MSKIEAIELPEFTVKKTGEKKNYYKIKSEGKTYSAFPGTVAFKQLQDGIFSLGDNVKLNYEPSKVGDITYKNLTKLEESDEETTPTVPRSAPSNMSSDEIRQLVIVRQNALRHADELTKVHAQVDGEVLTAEKYFGTAANIEKWIWRGIKEVKK